MVLIILPRFRVWGSAHAGGGVLLIEGPCGGCGCERDFVFCLHYDYMDYGWLKCLQVFSGLRCLNCTECRLSHSTVMLLVRMFLLMNPTYVIITVEFVIKR